MIGQGHGKGKALQFCLYLGYTWNNFKIFCTRMMSSDLANVGNCHHLQKLPDLSYYMTDFCQTFIEILTL